MYRVIKLYGDCEPWWFLDGWEEDIVASKEFQNYGDALRYYQREWVFLSETYPHKKNKTGMMAAFWTPTEQLWCEECNEYLQQYHSLILMESDEYLPKGLRSKRERRIRPCQLK